MLEDVRHFCGSQNLLLFSQPTLGGLIPSVSASAPPKSRTLPEYVTSWGPSEAQIQLISGHESKKSPEIYQHLSLGAVEQAYQEAVQGVSI
jgi:hypothetical protein